MQWRCITLIDEVWLKSLAYPSGEEEGKFLVQIISTCLRYVERKGGGDPRRVGWIYLLYFKYSMQTSFFLHFFTVYNTMILLRDRWRVKITLPQPVGKYM